MYSIQEIRENYKEFSDSKIITIAQNESKGLRKEVVGILIDELKKRNLSERLVYWVQTETNTFEGIERDLLVKKIQQLHCPNCEKKVDRLYGFEINQVVSVVLFAYITQHKKVMCSSCGKNAKFIAILITFFAGWWSRRGIFLTPWIVVRDSFNFLIIPKISRKIIHELIDENTGHFRRNGTENEVLVELLKSRNNINFNKGKYISTP